MKKFALATVMSLIAASAMASGAPTDSYPYGYQPHGDLSAVTKEQPRAVPHRPAKSDDSAWNLPTSATPTVLPTIFIPPITSAPLRRYPLSRYEIKPQAV